MANGGLGGYISGSTTMMKRPDAGFSYSGSKDGGKSSGTASTTSSTKSGDGKTSLPSGYKPNSSGVKVLASDNSNTSYHYRTPNGLSQYTALQSIAPDPVRVAITKDIVNLNNRDPGYTMKPSNQYGIGDQAYNSIGYTGGKTQESLGQDIARANTPSTAMMNRPDSGFGMSKNPSYNPSLNTPKMYAERLMEAPGYRTENPGPLRGISRDGRYSSGSSLTAMLARPDAGYAPEPTWYPSAVAQGTGFAQRPDAGYSPNSMTENLDPVRQARINWGDGRFAVYPSADAAYSDLREANKAKQFTALTNDEPQLQSPPHMDGGMWIGHKKYNSDGLNMPMAGQGAPGYNRDKMYGAAGTVSGDSLASLYDRFAVEHTRKPKTMMTEADPVSNPPDYSSNRPVGPAASYPRKLSGAGETAVRVGGGLLGGLMGGVPGAIGGFGDTGTDLINRMINMPYSGKGGQFAGPLYGLGSDGGEDMYWKEPEAKPTTPTTPKPATPLPPVIGNPLQFYYPNYTQADWANLPKGLYGR